MGKNLQEINWLNKDPERLLLHYQDLIWTIVRYQQKLGRVALRDQEDLVQEINHRLLERLPRIKEQYNGSCKLSTYFSVIIRNLCLEENRRMNELAEPEPDPYGSKQPITIPVDNFLYLQEYDRFQRAMKLLGKHYPRFNLIVRFICGVEVKEKELRLFLPHEKVNLRQSCEEINAHLEALKKDKFEFLAGFLENFEEKKTSDDSLRKWYGSRLKEALNLMNGHPPTRAYDVDSLGVLLEKGDIGENNE